MLPFRLMVGHDTLDVGIEVRILEGEFFFRRFKDLTNKRNWKNQFYTRSDFSWIIAHTTQSLTLFCLRKIIVRFVPCHLR